MVNRSIGRRRNKSIKRHISKNASKGNRRIRRKNSKRLNKRTRLSKKRGGGPKKAWGGPTPEEQLAEWTYNCQQGKLPSQIDKGGVTGKVEDVNDNPTCIFYDDGVTWNITYQGDIPGGQVGRYHP